MEKWRKLSKQSLTTVGQIAQALHVPPEELAGLDKMFLVKINPYYLSLIKAKGDPLYRQVVPDKAELQDDELLADPLQEDQDSPVRSIVHRYPDRCLFLVSHECAAYCRFCTRKRKVGNPEKISAAHIEEGLQYIRTHPEIRDVIVSGGDPLMLSDRAIEYILASLRKISHVEIIRIGSRVPCFLPQRITTRLVRILRKYHPLYMNVHFNHPDELTAEAISALGKLADAGIPLGNQTVLLKGINDTPEVMKKLMQKLLIARVKPYYIYQTDLVFGTEHFRTRVEKGLELIKALRGWTSGLAIPHFVIDAPGGGGKIPLLPEYVKKISDDEIVMQNYQGKTYRYRQVGAKNRKKAPVKKVMSEIFATEPDLHMN